MTTKSAMPTVMELAFGLLNFEYVNDDELRWGVDVMFVYILDKWEITRADYMANVDNPSRFYIGLGMQRYQAYAIAREMIRLATIQNAKENS